MSFRIHDAEPGHADARKSDVLVVGGGVIGVCTAHALQERGVRTTLVERGEICAGASHGNGGWIFPSESKPIPGPGVIRESLPWLIDPESPLYIQPRPSLSLLRWMWQFRAACNEPDMRRSFALRRALSLASLELYERLAATEGLEFGFRREGLIVACRTRKALIDFQKDIRLLEAEGGSAKWLSADELCQRNPTLSPSLAGGIEFPSDAHITPGDFVRNLAVEIERRGASIHPNTEVLDIEWARRPPLRVRTTRGDFTANEVVLAAGAWTPELGRDLGLRVPVQAAKGYSISVERPEEHPKTPVMLAEAKVFVTPMGGLLRMGGTLELAGLDLRINRRRLDAVARATRTYMPKLAPTPTIEIWRGLRPLTPDDLPIIGRPHGTQGLILATGHGMSGISQGPMTGELIAQMVTGETPSLDIAPFSPDRF
jgi:D-amino-acid dehydrogenase